MRQESNLEKESVKTIVEIPISKIVEFSNFSRLNNLYCFMQCVYSDLKRKELFTGNSAISVLSECSFSGRVCCQREGFSA